jgi:hypothetical protein
MTIRLNDSSINWKRGQRFRLSFGDRVYLGSFTVTILTNALGEYPLTNPSNSTYSTVVISLDDSLFSPYDYKPVMDIVCIDDNALKFQVDMVGKSLTNNQ